MYLCPADTGTEIADSGIVAADLDIVAAAAGTARWRMQDSPVVPGTAQWPGRVSCLAPVEWRIRSHVCNRCLQRCEQLRSCPAKLDWSRSPGFPSVLG